MLFMPFLVSWMLVSVGMAAAAYANQLQPVEVGMGQPGGNVLIVVKHRIAADTCRMLRARVRFSKRLSTHTDSTRSLASVTMGVKEFDFAPSASSATTQPL